MFEYAAENIPQVPTSIIFSNVILIWVIYLMHGRVFVASRIERRASSPLEVTIIAKLLGVSPGLASSFTEE